MRALRATAGVALLLAGTLAATPAVAAARWGLDVGAQWGGFGPPAFQPSTVSGAPGHYRVGTLP